MMMTFAESVDFYSYLHNQNANDYLNHCTIHANVNKAALLDYLLYEYADMLTIDSDTDTFHDHVKNFFDIHEWNINKLAESQHFEYNPIGNVDYRETTDYDRGQEVDTTENRDVVTDFDRTDNITDAEDTVTDRDETIDVADIYHEDDTDQAEDINYVSAFNDGSDDSKHHRDTHEGSATKDSTDTKNTIDNEHINVDRDEQIDETEVTKTVKDDDFVGNEQLVETQDTVHDKHGHDNTHSYQELIEEERDQAQFNLYKWIAKHFAKEMLIAVWG